MWPGLLLALGVAIPLYDGPKIELTKVADGVYATVFPDKVDAAMNGNGLVADSQDTPAAARLVIAEIKKITSNPVRDVVNTHFHGDHHFENQAVDLSTHTRTAVFETDSSRANRRRYIKPDSTPDFAAALPNVEYFYDQHVRAIGNEWTMGSFLSSPVVVDDVVYVGSMNGALYALSDR